MNEPFNASRRQLPRFRQPTAADLCVPTLAVPSETTNMAVLALFTERRDLMTMPVVEGQRPIGLISRNIFMSQMSKPFYQELYGRKSCIAFMDKEPLTVEAETSIEALTFRAVEYGEKALADGFIVTRDGALQGVGYGLQLMNVVATMQAEKNRQITHSIEYASVIQRALLRGSDDALAATLADAALVWQPRDIVGGDFYHFQRVRGGWLAVIADCTGHGVPGAFMTLIASSLLNQALQAAVTVDPGALLAALNRGVKSMLSQHAATSSSTVSNDGLDAAVLWYDTSTGDLSYAGARLPLFVLGPDDADWTTLAGDRLGAGYVETPVEHSWPVRRVPVAPGSLLFVCTDGLVDQIGGPREISYGKRRVREQLLARRTQPVTQMAARLQDDFALWQGEQPRRDDMTFFCCRI